MMIKFVLFVFPLIWGWLVGWQNVCACQLAIDYNLNDVFTCNF